MDFPRQLGAQSASSRTGGHAHHGFRVSLRGLSTRVLQRLLYALPLLLLALGMAAGCHSTVPSLLLHIADPTGLSPTQLRVKVSVEDQETHNLTRPETPNGPLESPQTLRLFMADEAVGQRVDLTVEALLEGIVIGSATATTVVQALEDSELALELAPLGWLEHCDATTCPFGCCDGNVCVEGDLGACGFGGAACAACDAVATDQCLEGACRCGADAPCPVGYQCEDGACAPNGEGQSCTVDAQCTNAPGQCLNEQGFCGDDGKCGYTPKPAGEDCDDNNSCQEGDQCDGNGVCVSTPIVCDTPGQCQEAAGTCVNGACHYPSKPTTAVCNDHMNCTTPDRCDGMGACVGTVACNDPPNQECWEPVGQCQAGECAYEVKVNAPCGTNDACTTSRCNESGQCVSTQTACNPPSNNGCYTAACYPATGCLITVNEGVTCTVSDACTVGTTCQKDGSCGGGSPKCAPPPNALCWNPTTCNTTTGVCTQHMKQPGTSCGTASACQTKTCSQTGECETLTLADGASCGLGCQTCQSGVCQSCQFGETCCGNVCRLLLPGEVCTILPEEPI